MKAFLILAALALSACGVDAVADCHGVCGRYKSCFDASYDTDSCESRCRSKAANDAVFRKSVDACDACIDTKACTTAVFSCGTNCSSVVP